MAPLHTNVAAGPATLRDDATARPSMTATPEPRWLRRGEPAFRRMNAALFLAGIATFSMIYCVQPLLPLFTDAFGVSAAASSLALSLTTGSLAMSILLCGPLSDRLGRRAVMTTSLFTAAALHLASAAAPGWPAFLALRTAEGFALGGAPAIAMAYLAEEVDPRGLGFAMGLYVGGTSIGGMAGRIVTGLLADLLDWRGAEAGIGLLGVAAAAGFVWLLPPSRNFVGKPFASLTETATGVLRQFGRPGLPAVYGSGALLVGGFVTVYNYAGFRLQAPPYGLSQSASGAVFLLYALGPASATAAGALADRVGRAPMLGACGLLLAAGVMLTLATPLALVVTGIGLCSIGFFGGHAVCSGWVGRLAGPAKGQAASLYLLCYYLGSSMLGSLGGFFWTHGGWPAVAGFVAGLLVIQVLVAARLWSRPPPDA